MSRWSQEVAPAEASVDVPRAVRTSLITMRALLLGTSLTLIWGAISAYTDHYARVTWSFGWGALPSGPVAVAFLLVLGNGLLLRLAPRVALRRSELLIIYSMLTVAAAVIVAYVPYMLPIATYPYYRARIEAGWEGTVLPYLPSWLQVRTPELAPWFWEGLPQGASIPWRDWTLPLLGWGAPVPAFLAAMLCLGALLRKDWIERQRLTFPLTEIPLGLVGEGEMPTLRAGVFGRRVFWLGFGVGGGLSLLVWLSYFYPVIPAPQLRVSIGQTFSGAGLPWSALSLMVVSITPATLGIMCLLPTEISFSLWACYGLFLAFLVFCGALGIPPQGSQAMGNFVPRGFADYAGAGGFVVVSAMVLYQARGAFASGFRALFRHVPEEADPRAPMSNRAALLGLVAANAFLCVWAWYAGMSWWSFGLIMLAFYVAMIGAARLVAAAGLTQPRPQPSTRWMVTRIVGAGALDPRSLLMYNYLTMGYMLEPQNFGIVYLMNSFKLLHTGHIRGRRFPTAAMLAGLAALVAGSAGLLYTTYHYGAITMDCWPITAAPTCTFREFTTSLSSPEKADPWLQVAMVVGGVFTLALFWLTSRFVWWPLSPIGFIVASVYHTNEHVWTNALLGWTIATLIRHYGGLRLYRALRPAFLGLVLGQFLVSVGLAIFFATVLGARGAPELFS